MVLKVNYSEGAQPFLLSEKIIIAEVGKEVVRRKEAARRWTILCRREDLDGEVESYLTQLLSDNGHFQSSVCIDDAQHT